MSEQENHVSLFEFDIVLTDKADQCLSPKQSRIVKLWFLGITNNSRIAKIIGISPQTIKNHQIDIASKLGTYGNKIAIINELFAQEIILLKSNTYSPTPPPEE